MNWRRPLLSLEVLIVVATAYVLAVANGPFWRAVIAGRDPASVRDLGFVAALAAWVAALYFVVLGLLATRWTVRPLLALWVLVGVQAAYYMDRYAIYLDRAMVRNILATHYDEASELFSLRMVGHVLLWGVLPALALWWPRLRSRTWQRALGVRLAWMVGAVVLAVAAILPVFADFASLMRNHKEVRHLITPGNALRPGRSQGGISCHHRAGGGQAGAAAPGIARQGHHRIARGD